MDINKLLVFEASNSLDLVNRSEKWENIWLGNFLSVWRVSNMLARTYIEAIDKENASLPLSCVTNKDHIRRKTLIYM